MADTNSIHEIVDLSGQVALITGAGRGLGRHFAQGPLLCSRNILPGMVSRGRGRIINLASGAGLRAIPYFSAYDTGKTALIRFIENLALETREFGISVFAITPGTVRTAMSEDGMSPKGRKWIPWLANIFKEGRDLPPDPAVNLVIQLASGRADALSGCYISVKDDLDELIERAGELERNGLYKIRLNTKNSLV